MRNLLGVSISQRRHGVIRVFGALVALIAMLATTMPAWAIPLEQLADPRLSGSWLLDTTSSVSPAANRELSAITEKVRQSGQGELLVVVIDSVDGASSRDYATRLFNNWRIGATKRNDGVLILVAMKDRKAEIVLGDGIDDEKQVRESERIMAEEMVPQFKAGDPNGAIVSGAQACVTHILGAKGFFGRVRSYIGKHAAMIWGASALLFAGLAAGAVAIGRTMLRYRPRKCKCGGMMAKLNEVDDDAHLDSAQRAEERLGSVNYDVWLCGCGAVERVRYGALFTSYSTCDGCGAKTSVESSNIIEHATEYREGLREVTESCAHCNHRSSYTVSISRLASSSSSDSSYSSSDSSYSSSSSSSSSGGSSSGAGASGSW